MRTFREMGGFVGPMRRQTNLLSESRHRFPIESRQHILDEEWIELDFDLFEFGFFGMERKGQRRGLAGLAGAGEEVEGEELHIFVHGAGVQELARYFQGVGVRCSQVRQATRCFSFSKSEETQASTTFAVTCGICP